LGPPNLTNNVRDRILDNFLVKENKPPTNVNVILLLKEMMEWYDAGDHPLFIKLSVPRKCLVLSMKDVGRPQNVHQFGITISSKMKTSILDYPNLPSEAHFRFH
jgi:hypothetical protein